jgi:hypothetical protein
MMKRIVVATFLLGTILPIAVTAPFAGASSAAAVTPCSPGGVVFTNGTPGSAATQEEPDLLKITNNGSTACRRSGYATWCVYTSNGRTLPFTFTHHATGGWPIATKIPKSFVISRHKSAYVFFAQEACESGVSQSSSRIAIQLPHTTRLSKIVLLSTPLMLCRGSSAAVGNVIALSPIEPSAYATQG